MATNRLEYSKIVESVSDVSHIKFDENQYIIKDDMYFAKNKEDQQYVRYVRNKKHLNCLGHVLGKFIGDKGSIVHISPSGFSFTEFYRLRDLSYESPRDGKLYKSNEIREDQANLLGSRITVHTPKRYGKCTNNLFLMRAKELRLLCNQNVVKSSGSKKDLIKRLFKL